VTDRSQSGLEQSIKQRLLNVSRAGGETFNRILIRYGIERFLYRLTRSAHANQFVLKGAVLFSIWAETPHRATQDLDLLGFGEASPEKLTPVIRDICRADVEPDGLIFDPATIDVQPIRADAVYDGMRVRVRATLGSARINVQIDVGFGDVVTPEATVLTLESMLALPSASIRAYPPETVVAEKLEAIVTLAMSNSRMKDYFDLWTLSQTMSFDLKILREAVAATFHRRRTALIEMPPPGLTEAFGADSAKRAQWAAFIRKMGSGVATPDLAQVVERIGDFLLPSLGAGEVQASSSWPPRGPWQSAAS
jgi:predicted nucleotidyltransferase component of viral defense system